MTAGPRVCATYVWIDGSGETMRSKVKVLETKPSKVEDLPQWNYDGSSCYQANGDNSDVYLTPVKMYPCPFTRGDNLLVLCETCTNSVAGSLTAISKSFWVKFKDLTRCSFATMKARALSS